MNIQKRLILIPTYNELENSQRLCLEILALKLKGTDILFVDDNSPDGTGKLLEKISKKNKKVKVIHRTGKSGIGSAHLVGINWAYKHGYKELVTMDCDFTHSPSDITRMIVASKDFDIIVGSRYLGKKSLVGWNIYRKALTIMGHIVTKMLLGMNYDASGAFRLYRLDRIPRKIFNLVSSKTYSFFLESLYILNLNGMAIGEISIKLPPRTYGHSKMKLKDVLLSVELIISLYLRTLADIDRFRVKGIEPLKNSREVEYWEEYWEGDALRGKRFLYDLVASFYRRFLIKPTFNYFIRKYFKRGSNILHAGCGGGEVDMDMIRYVRITALDFSQNALKKYQERNGKNGRVVLGDVRSLPFKGASFDGVYNLGVMEHFKKNEILKILKEFNRVLKPRGRLIIFWPPEFGLSVVFFKSLVYIYKKILGRKRVVFHPPEISRLRSERQAKQIFNDSGLEVIEYYFGVRDLFTYCVIVAKRK